MGSQCFRSVEETVFENRTQCLLEEQTHAYDLVRRWGRFRVIAANGGLSEHRDSMHKRLECSSPPGAFPGRAPTLGGWTVQFQRSAMESFMRDQAPAIAPPATARATTV